MMNTGSIFQQQDQKQNRIQDRLLRVATVFSVLLAAAFPLAAQVAPNTAPTGVPQLQFVPAQLSLFAGQTGGGCSETGVPGPAVSANFCTAVATAVDASGNTYIVDSSLNTVYKVDTSGNISVFAGVPTNSTTGSYSGDGGLATAATLSQPSDVAVDASGNVYIADYGNSRVRKVDATGKITTFVGGGIGYFNGGSGTAVAISPSGITFDPSGNLYVADNPQSLIIKVTTTGAASLFAGFQAALGRQGTAGYNGDNISAVGAELNFPTYVASDSSGNIYIADTNNCRIREVTVATGTITTVAGNGTCGNTGDGGAATSAQIRGNTVATDLAGDIYFSNGVTIRRVDTSGNIITVAGGGTTQPAGYPTPATSAAFNVAANQTRMDNNGTLLIPVRTSGYQVVAAGPNGDLQFGNQNVGVASSPLTITLTNTGSATLILTPSSFTFGGANPTDFSRQGLTCGYTLAAGASCTIQFVFTPGGPGVRSATMTVPTNANQQPVIVLGGTGVQPIVTASPTSLNFGTELWNHVTSPQYVTLTNTSGYYTATFGTFGSTDGDFTVSAYSCGSTLAPGATCQLSVVFEPMTYANQSYSGTGSIQYTSNSGPAGSTPTSVSFSLSGNGVTYPAGVSATPTSIAFGSQTEYTQSNPQTVYVLNQSGATVNFSGTTISGPFTIYQDGCGFGIPAGYQCTYLVAFYPKTVGTSQTGTLTIPFAGASGSPLTVTLTGNGTAGTALMNVYPSQVNFGTTPVGTPPLVTPVTETVTVSNNSTAPFSNIVISITGVNAADYSETDNCAANSPILPNGSSNCTITISFSAGGAGARNATLNVSSNASNSPQTVSLTGAGVASVAELQFTPAQLNLIAGAGGACGSTATTATATSASLCNVNSATQDYLGNTYLVDTTYNVVYKVDTTGNLTVFAGTPSLTGGYTGDSGPAASATLSAPTAVAADAFGNIFISDPGNQAVREVSGGTITTYVNNATCFGERPSPGPAPSIAPPVSHVISTCRANFHPQGQIFDRSGNLFIADPQNNVVYEFPAGQNYTKTVAGIYGTGGYNGDSISATSAQLNGPQDVAVDTAGNLYIADTLNYRVRKVDTSGNITTYAGYGVQGNNEDGYPANVAEINPVGVATNLAGDVYISSGAGGIVRKVDTSGTISTIAGQGTGAIGGQATTAAIANAFLSRVDNNGNLLIPTGLQLLAAGPDGILQFGSQAVNVASNPLTVVLEDTGNIPLSFGTTIATVNGTNASDFTFGSFCGYNLMGGKTCKLGVTFTPGGSGPRSAYLSIPTNATGSPQIVLLQGNGAGAAAPTATLSGIAFGNQTQNTTSSAMSATLTNTGSTALTISNIAITGNNPINFTVSTGTNACGTSLNAGASCSIYVTFSPTSVTGYNATLSVTDNATVSPTTSALSGTGTAAAGPTATLSGIAFGNQPEGTTGSAMTATLSNTSTTSSLTIGTISLSGTNAANFAVVPGGTCGSTLAANTSCTIAVTFSPPGVSTGYTATLSVATNATGTPQTSNLSGNGTYVKPTVTLSPSPYNFGSVPVNTKSTAQVFTLTNTSTAPFPFTQSVSDSTNFAITGTTCTATLSAGKNCTITVIFQPQSPGPFSAGLNVTDYGDSVTVSDAISGTGAAAAAPVASLTSSIAFPNTTQGVTAASMTATLSNTGNATLNITSIVLGGTNAADFALVTSTNPCGPTLAAGSSCLIAATFTPLGTSSYIATITVTDNSATPTQSVTVTGSGTAIPAPVASLSPTIAFPSTTQGVTSASMTATLTNTGNATLSINSIVLGGTNAADFAIVTSTNPCGPTLAAGSSCLIAATFTPLGTSSYTANITVTDNSATPTQSATLTGSGTPAAATDFSISSNTNQQTVIGGNPATYSIAVTPVGGPFTGTILLAASGLPSGSTATFTPQSLTPGSSAASSSLVITTLPQQARLQRRKPWLPPSIMVAFLLPLLWRRRRQFHSVRLGIILLAAVLSGAMLSLSGCVGTGGLQLPSANYTVTVTGTSGTTTHTTTVILTVQ